MYRVLLLWCLCNAAWAQESLQVGWASWHPFSFRDEQQQLQGLDIDLLQAIFSRAGFSASYSEMPWARVLRELEFGTIQLTMSANQTAERERYARFSLPYRNEETVLLVRRQDRARWPSPPAVTPAPRRRCTNTITTRLCTRSYPCSAWLLLIIE